MERSEGQRSPQASPPTCAVVVPTRNRASLLDRVLEAVARQDYQPFDLLVVDSAPSDSAAEEVARRRGARYVLEPQAGASRARNRGAALSQAEVVAFLDDDALPEPDWLRHLLAEFSAPEVAVVTGCVLPWPKASAAGVQANVVRGAGADGRFGGEERFALDRNSPGWLARCAFGGFGIAANMAVRRSVFEQVGGFNPVLGPGAPLLLCEEYYLYFELIRRGHRGIYAPQAIVHHPFLAVEDDLARRYLVSRTAGSAFLTFLLARHPRYAPGILGYVFRRLAGAHSAWGRAGLLPRPAGVTRWQTAKALLSGPALFLRHRTS